MRFLPFWRHRALSFGRVPVFGRKSDSPEARRGLREAKSHLGLSIHNVAQGYHSAGNFFIGLQVRQEKRLFLDNGGRELNEAAIGIDGHGLSDFFEGWSGFIISVDKDGNSDVYSRGSVPCNFGIRHKAHKAVGFNVHTPTMGIVPLFKLGDAEEQFSMCSGRVIGLTMDKVSLSSKGCVRRRTRNGRSGERADFDCARARVLI